MLDGISLNWKFIFFQARLRHPVVRDELGLKEMFFFTLNFKFKIFTDVNHASFCSLN